MSLPFSANNSGSKGATTDVVVELSHSHVPPTLPFELKDHVSPNTWAIRASALIRLASRYYRPTFERAFLVVLLVLTFLVPIVTYYVTLQTPEDTQANDPDKQVWLARFTCFAVTGAMWIVFSVPIVVWKHLGGVRVTRLAEQWTKMDALAAPSYGAAPVWKASTPGLFRDAIVLMVTVPVINKSHFDPDSYLPPYIAVGDDALPPYRHSNTVNWSKDPRGGIKYGELPIYNGDNSTAV